MLDMKHRRRRLLLVNRRRGGLVGHLLLELYRVYKSRGSYREASKTEQVHRVGLARFVMFDIINVGVRRLGLRPHGCGRRKSASFFSLPVLLRDRSSEPRLFAGCDIYSNISFFNCRSEVILGSHGYLQNFGGRLSPSLRDLHTVREIAQIAEHACAILRALFATIIALICRVRADELKDSKQNRRREFADKVLSRRREGRRRQISVTWIGILIFALQISFRAKTF